MPVKIFLYFFVNPNFTWLLGLGIHFYYFSGGSGGRSPPEIFGGFSGWFFNIFVSVKSFFAFLGGVWGRSPQKIFEIFHFSDAGGGATENFFWLFPDFLMSEKNRWGGGRRNFFFWRNFFTAPYLFLLNKTSLFEKSDPEFKGGPLLKPTSDYFWIFSQIFVFRLNYLKAPISTSF